MFTLIAEVFSNQLMVRGELLAGEEHVGYRESVYCQSMDMEGKARTHVGGERQLPTRCPKLSTYLLTVERVHWRTSKATSRAAAE